MTRLLLISTLLVLGIGARAESPRIGLVCGALLDQQELAGRPFVPGEVQRALDRPLELLTDKMSALDDGAVLVTDPDLKEETSELIPGSRLPKATPRYPGFWARLRGAGNAVLARAGADRFARNLEDYRVGPLAFHTFNLLVSDGVLRMTKAIHHGALRTETPVERHARGTMIARLRRLRAEILDRPNQTAPIRRVTRGRENIVRFLETVRDQATVDTDALEEAQIKHILDTHDRVAAIDRTMWAQHRAINARLFETDRLIEVFGPRSELSAPARLGVLGAYLAVVAPPFVFNSAPLTWGAAAAVTGTWLVGRQYAYYAVEHARLQLRGFFEQERVISKLLRGRLSTRRSNARFEDLNALIKMTNDPDATSAMAYLTFPEPLPIDSVKFGRDSSLNREGIRQALDRGATPGRRARWLRTHLILTLAEDGEPELVTYVVETSRWERLRDKFVTFFTEMSVDPGGLR